jgi:hypothetical protein
MPLPAKFKEWYKSRTIIVNGITFLVTTLMAAQTAIQGTSIVTDYPTVVLGISSALSILNIVLRTVTTLPVK